MASLEYYFSDNEMIELVHFVLTKKHEFIPDRPYPSPHYLIMSSLQQIMAVRKCESLSRSWFLVRDDYSVMLPLPMSELSTALGKSAYWIKQRYAGPTIDLLWSGNSKEKGDHAITPGQLSHHASFIDPVSREEMRASESLRAAYKELSTWIRSRSVRSEQAKGQPGAWIGLEAARAWKAGAPLGHPPFTRRPSRVPDE
jgi:hypothetical protein